MFFRKSYNYNTELNPVLKEYYKTYLDRLFECCETEFAIANGENVQQKYFEDIEVPQGCSSDLYSFKMIKESYRDDLLSFKPLYCTFNNCVLYHVEWKLDSLRGYVDTEYILKVKDYVRKYEKLKKQGCDFSFRAKPDIDEDCEYYASSLRETIEEAKEEIYQLIKQGCFCPYKKDYQEYASSMHAYLIDLRNELQSFKRKVWYNLPRDIKNDLDYVITKYNYLQISLREDYDV